MASTRLQQYQLVASATFQGQVAGSLLALAAYVIGTELAGVTNHAARLAYANAIITAPLGQAAFLAPGMLSQVAIVTDAGLAVGPSGTSVPDADCDAAVTTLFNFYATQYVAQVNSGAPLLLGH